MRGPNIFTASWGKEEATREALVDGWLHSSDLGEIDADGYLAITGRKKDHHHVERQDITLRTSRTPSARTAGCRRPSSTETAYLTALITLDPDEAPALGEHVGADDADPAALSGDQRVRTEIQRVMDEANRRFARIEQVKKFAILPRDLSQDEDELTPTLKVKRNVVYDRHAQTFAGLYE